MLDEPDEKGAYRYLRRCRIFPNTNNSAAEGARIADTYVTMRRVCKHGDYEVAVEGMGNASCDEKSVQGSCRLE